MKSNGDTKRIAAVTLAAVLTLSGSANAITFFGSGGYLPHNASVERPASLISQAATWVLGLWTGMTSALAESTSDSSDTTTQTCTEPCGDAGWGIDPEG